MAEQTTKFRCPSCTGPLHYGASSGKMECDYCGNMFEVAEIEALYKEPEVEEPEPTEGHPVEVPESADNYEGEWDAADINDNWGEDSEKIKVFQCSACGAELIGDQSTAATTCPYCDSPTIVQQQFKGALKPDYVIPFKIKKEDAIKLLKRHYEGKKLLPKAFKDENHVKEIKGVYVPFWLFDSVASADMWFNATKTFITRSGNRETTTTNHFQIHRKGSVPFEKIPVDASKKMPDDYMDGIEPFNYEDLTEFSIGYLPGFLADRYDVSVEESSQRADERMTQSVKDAMRNTVSGYDTCVTTSCQTYLQRGKVHYALLPVWMLTTKYKGENYLFAINGQTGKIASDLPIDKDLAKKYFIKYAAIAAVLCGIVINFII